MKNILLTLFITFVLFSCASHDYIIEYDYSYKSQFKRYKSFGFMFHDNADPLTSQNSSVIEDEIRFRMKLLGYDFNQNKPDLLVIYKIFDDNLKFRGFEQPDFKSWLSREDTAKKYTPVKYELSNGTLLVLLNDRKGKNTVWQGYASGISSETTKINNRVLKSSIISIFDQYEAFSLGLKKEEESE